MIHWFFESRGGLGCVHHLGISYCCTWYFGFAPPPLRSRAFSTIIICVLRLAVPDPRIYWENTGHKAWSLTAVLPHDTQNCDIFSLSKMRRRCCCCNRPDKTRQDKPNVGKVILLASPHLNASSNDCICLLSQHHTAAASYRWRKMDPLPPIPPPDLLHRARYPRID